MFFPGLGQFYADRGREGCFWAIGQVSLIAIAVYSIFNGNGNTVTGLLVLLAIAGLYIANLYHAFHCVYRSQTAPSSEKIPRTQKNPWFALFLSRILPGLGQFYIEQPILGGLFLGLTIVFSQIGQFLPILRFAIPAIAALSAYHAYTAFPNRQRLRFPPASRVALIAAIFFTFGALVNFFPYWIDHSIDRFEIPSSSMKPTLHIGDRVFVGLDRNYRPKRGDIIVFVAPEKAEALEPPAEQQQPTYYIKRVIGLPGEVAIVRQGRVYVNNQPLNENYIAETPTYQLNAQTVPTQSYFVLGDNRNDSFDSHVWGFLPAQNIVGRAYKIYWPPKRIRALD